MKFKLGVALLIVSLAGNVYLAGKLARTGRSEPATDSKAARGSRAVPPGDPGPGAGLQPEVSAVAARLKSDGVPNSVARSIVANLLDRQLNLRRRELEKLLPQVPYWSTAVVPSVYANPAASEELRAMAASNLRTLFDLFGPSLGTDPFTLAADRSQFGNLSPAKIDQLKLINADYAAMSAALAASFADITLPGDREKLQFIEHSRLGDLQEVLTPSEYQEYLYRSTVTGNNLRSSLTFFEPTESEFRALFEVQRAFDDRYVFAGESQQIQFERNLALGELKEDLKAVLDPARQEDFERATDIDYRQTRDFAARFGLSRQAADRAWRIQRETQQRAAAILSNPALSPNLRQTQLESLRQSASAALQDTLGSSRALESYQHSAGQWLESLDQPRPSRVRP